MLPRAPKDWDCDFEQSFRCEGSSPDYVAESLTSQQLHCEVCVPLKIIDTVDRTNIRMIQRRGGAGFALESFACLDVLTHCSIEKFQCCLTAQAHVQRAIDNSHATESYAFENSVWPDLLSNPWVCDIMLAIIRRKMFRLRLKEAFGGIIGIQQGFNFGAQVCVTPARGIQKTQTLFWREHTCVIKYGANMSPLLRIQGFASHRLL